MSEEGHASAAAGSVPGTSLDARALIARFSLRPHPEGGWYRELHRSHVTVAAPAGRRCALTSIYYLLERGQCGRWHVVEADEAWHFHGGAPLELITYEAERRELGVHMLGEASSAAEPIAIVPGGMWQAARSCGEYSFVGCTVGPGFEFADFRFIADLPGHEAHFAGPPLQPFAALL